MGKLNNHTFSFNYVYREEIVREIDKLSNKNCSQKTDSPVKIIKKYKGLISYFYIITLITRRHALPFLLP